MNYLSRLICWIYGHKRGKRTAASDSVERETGHAIYCCPRCGATWTRKVKAAPNIPESIKKGDSVQNIP